MFATFTQKLKIIANDVVLRKRVLFLLAMFALYRVLASIPIPGVDAAALEQFFSNNQFFGLLNIFSGGGLSGLSIIMLGVGPYITGSIIMQLLTIMSPRLKAMYQEEGEAGRRKFSQYSRLLSVPLSIIQGFGFLTLLQRSGVITNLDSFTLVTNLIVITAGSLLLMWIGELISEFGIGNGMSLIIFAGIVAQLPTTFNQLRFTYTPDQLPLYIAFAVIAVLTILGVVFVTEAERPVPITHAKQVRGSKTYGGSASYLPLRLNQSGVIPIIFALSIMLFPQMLVNFISTSTNDTLISISSFIIEFLNSTWPFAITYFILVFLFTYFYTAITFDPEQIAGNLKRTGAFVPGVRPGRATEEYLGRLITRLTLVGALFLGIIAVLPILLRGFTANQAFAIGGTGLLIAVSVVIDLIKKLDAQTAMREY